MTVDPHDPHAEDASRPSGPAASSEQEADRLADELIGDLSEASERPADPFASVGRPGATEEAADHEDLGPEEARGGDAGDDDPGNARRWWRRRRASEDDPAEGDGSGSKGRGARSFWRELPILIIAALVVAVLIKTFLVQAFFIPSGSMSETLVIGDRVMVNKLSYVFGDPGRGDVIVFDNPAHEGDGESLLGALVRHVGESLGVSSPDSALIKRVIAVGGETIEIRDNRVLIDGEAIDEPYLEDNVRMRDYGPTEVPEEHVFVMGDNRVPGGSHDSRSFGPIPEDDIVGRAFVIIWPASRWSGL